MESVVQLREKLKELGKRKGVNQDMKGDPTQAGTSQTWSVHMWTGICSETGHLHYLIA